MDSKKLLYINIVLFLGLILILVIGRKTLVPQTAPKGPAVKKQAVQGAAQVPTYDIDKLKTAGAKVETEAGTLSEVYDKYPASDTGSDIVKEWSKVSEKDRAEFIQGIDDKISDARQALSLDPNDKKAKHLLKISEALKKLILSEFNYKVNK